VNPWDFGRGNTPAAVIAVVLLIGWPVLLVGLPVAFVWFVVRPTVKLLWRHPVTTTAVTATTVPSVLVGPVETAGFVVGLGLVVVLELVAWRLVNPASFARFVSGPVRLRRRKSRYERRWADLMTGLGLGLVFTTPRRRGVERTTAVPGLVSVTCGPWVDRLVVRPVVGQDLSKFERAAPAMAMHLGVRAVRAVVHDDGSVRFEILRADPLARTIPALPIGEHVDLSGLPIGVREDGTPWTVSLLGGNHTFIGGVTRAGKSSVVWSILRALAPAVHAGWVQLWAIDPKIMEATLGPELFHRLATGRDPEAMVRLLEDAVAVMHERADRLAGVARTHSPSPDEPFIVVLVDELAFLTAWGGSKTMRDKVNQALSVLCTQGRAVGVEVIAAAQDVRKDVVGMRNLFPVKIALRLDEKTQVDMLLGDGARDQGALCDQIPDSLPGVGYVKVDGIREPQRVRAAYVSDEDIRALAARYPAPIHRLHLTVIAEDQGDELGGAA
jgi:S-DNA-T family DNA segregation ATPase FtsK/SpoIIIE